VLEYPYCLQFHPNPHRQHRPFLLSLTDEGSMAMWAVNEDDVAAAAYTDGAAAGELRLQKAFVSPIPGAGEDCFILNSSLSFHPVLPLVFVSALTCRVSSLTTPEHVDLFELQPHSGEYLTRLTAAEILHRPQLRGVETDALVCSFTYSLTDQMQPSSIWSSKSLGAEFNATSNGSAASASAAAAKTRSLQPISIHSCVPGDSGDVLLVLGVTDRRTLHPAGEDAVATAVGSGSGGGAGPGPGAAAGGLVQLYRMEDLSCAYVSSLHRSSLCARTLPLHTDPMGASEQDVEFTFLSSKLQSSRAVLCSCRLNVHRPEAEKVPDKPLVRRRSRTLSFGSAKALPKEDTVVIPPHWSLPRIDAELPTLSTNLRPVRLKVVIQPLSPGPSKTTAFDAEGIGNDGGSAQAPARLTCVFYKNLYGNGRLERDLDPYLCPLLQYAFVPAGGNVSTSARQNCNPANLPSAIDGTFLEAPLLANGRQGEGDAVPFALLEYSSAEKLCVLSFYDVKSLLLPPQIPPQEQEREDADAATPAVPPPPGISDIKSTLCCTWKFPPTVLIRRVFPLQRPAQEQDSRSLVESTTAAFFVALKCALGGAELLYHFQESTTGNLDATSAQAVLRRAPCLELDAGERVVDVAQQFFGKSAMAAPPLDGNVGRGQKYPLCLFGILTSQRVLVVNEGMEILSDSSASPTAQDDAPHPLSMLWAGCVLLYTVYGRSYVRYLTAFGGAFDSTAGVLCSFDESVVGSGITLASASDKSLVVIHLDSSSPTGHTSIFERPVSLLEPQVAGLLDLWKYDDGDLANLRTDRGDAGTHKTRKKVHAARVELLTAVFEKFGSPAVTYDPTEKKMTRLDAGLTSATVAKLHAFRAHDLVRDTSDRFGKLCAALVPGVEVRRLSATACVAKREWLLALEMLVRDDPMLQEYVHDPNPANFVTLPHHDSSRARLFSQFAAQFEQVGQFEQSRMCYDMAGDDWSLLGMALSLGLDPSGQVAAGASSLGCDLASETLSSVERDSKNTDSLYKSLLQSMMKAAPVEGEQDGGMVFPAVSGIPVASTITHLPPDTRRSSLLPQEGQVLDVWACLKKGGAAATSSAASSPSSASSSSSWGKHVSMQAQKAILAPLSRVAKQTLSLGGGGGGDSFSETATPPEDFYPNDWFGRVLGYVPRQNGLAEGSGSGGGAVSRLPPLGPFGDDEDGVVGYWRFEDGNDGLFEYDGYAENGGNDDGGDDGSSSDGDPYSDAVFTFDKTMEHNHAIVEGSEHVDMPSASAVVFEKLDPDSESEQCPFDPGDGRKVKHAHTMVLKRWWLMGTGNGEEDASVEAGLKVPINPSSSMDIGFHMQERTRTNFALEMWTYLPADLLEKAGDINADAVVLACRKERWEDADGHTADNNPLFDEMVTPAHAVWSLQVDGAGDIALRVQDHGNDGVNLVSRTTVLSSEVKLRMGAWNHIALSAECDIGHGGSNSSGGKGAGAGSTSVSATATILLNGKLHQEVQFAQPPFRQVAEAWLYIGCAPLRSLEPSSPLASPPDDAVVANDSVKPPIDPNPKLAEVRFWARSRSEEQVSDFKDVYLKTAEKRAWGKVKIATTANVVQKVLQWRKRATKPHDAEPPATPSAGRALSPQTKEAAGVSHQGGSILQPPGSAASSLRQPPVATSSSLLQPPGPASSRSEGGRGRAGSSASSAAASTSPVSAVSLSPPPASSVSPGVATTAVVSKAISAATSSSSSASGAPGKNTSPSEGGSDAAHHALCRKFALLGKGGQPASAVIFHGPDVAVSVKQVFKGAKAKVMVSYKNMAQGGLELGGFNGQLSSDPPTNVQITTKNNLPSTLASADVSQVVEMACFLPFTAVQLSLSYGLGDGGTKKNMQLALPITVLNFVGPVQLTPEKFDQHWGGYAAAAAVLTLPHAPDGGSIPSKLLQEQQMSEIFHLGIVPSLPGAGATTEIVIKGAGILHTETPRDKANPEGPRRQVPCLLKMAWDPDGVAGNVDIEVRSPPGYKTVSYAITNAIKVLGV
jgi:hypothetical protein